MVHNSLLNQLCEMTEQVKASKTIQEGMAHLSCAFSIFSEETSRVEQAYSKLQKRFKIVNTELEKSYRALNDQVLQLDCVTHYLSNILRHMHQGILFIDLKGIITTYNAAAEKILSINHSSLIFQSFWDLFPDNFFNFSMREALEKMTLPPLFFITYLEKDLEISPTFVRKGLPASQGLILLIRDITEIEKLQKENSQKKQLQELREIAASFVHEIKSPLENIHSKASLIYQDLAKQPHLQEIAGHILESARDLNDFVEKIWEESRPLQLNKELINLSTLVKKIIYQIHAHPTFPKNIEIEMEIKESIDCIALDEHLITKALFTLFINRIEAMPQGGVLKIDLSQTRGKLFLVVLNTETHKEKNSLEKIFTPYFTTKGNGENLSNVYKIIEAHLGTIEVTSQVGVGTSFKISLFG